MLYLSDGFKGNNFLDVMMTFESNQKIISQTLALYAILKEVHGIERFQLIQHEQDRLELRLTAKNRKEKFAEAKQAIEMYLKQNGVSAEIYLTYDTPEANPISGKYKHIIAKCEMQSQIH